MISLPFPTILPKDPIMLGKNIASNTVLTTCIPMKMGHINFFKPKLITRSEREGKHINYNLATQFDAS